MNTIKDRIMQIPYIYGITKESFLSKIELTRGNFHGKARFTPINSDALYNILNNFPEINIEWVLCEKGHPLKTISKKSEQNEEVLTLYKELKDAQKKIIELQQENSELKIENERLKSAFTSDAIVPYAGRGCKTG